MTSSTPLPAKASSLLACIRAADRLSLGLGQVAAVCLVTSCLLSAAVALLRYAFNVGSNAWLEAQWYLFAAAVMLGAPALLKLNGHVRVDVFYGSRTPRTQAWIDLFGLLLFVLPFCVLFTLVSVPYVRESYLQHEYSASASGLLRWPVKLMLPVGFVLLGVQAVAELLRRIAFLAGWTELDTTYERPQQ